MDVFAGSICGVKTCYLSCLWVRNLSHHYVSSQVIFFSLFIYWLISLFQILICTKAYIPLGVFVYSIKGAGLDQLSSRPLFLHLAALLDNGLLWQNVVLYP